MHPHSIEGIPSFDRRDKGRPTMIVRPKCDCLICKLEVSLIAELSADGSGEKYQQLARRSLLLSGFPTSSDLIRHLHSIETENRQPSSDDLLLELLRPGVDPLLRQLWNSVLLLVFIPTIHRTTRQLSAIFPSLVREDIAQHLTTVLLEFLRSSDLRSRRSHLAFTIARKIRRSAFRWAIRESRIALERGPDGPTTRPSPGEASEDPSYSVVLLGEFLDSSERRGWLSSAERQLLTQSKIEGISFQELSERNGHSAGALQHQINRLIKRLHQRVQTPLDRTPEQLELFRK
jgi:DNA-directed RNA polymerase specialized sigma24 family protein